MNATITPTTKVTVAATRAGVVRTGLAVGLPGGSCNYRARCVRQSHRHPTRDRRRGDPIAGFAQLTFLCTLIGIGLAKLFARRARHPRRSFVRTTVALTVVSVLPDFAITTDPPTRVVLVLTHVLAAIIVIPTLAPGWPPTGRGQLGRSRFSRRSGCR